MGSTYLIAHGLLINDRCILLLKRASGRYLGGQWDIPGGTVEPDETPERAAERECYEETGISARSTIEISRQQNRDTFGRPIVFTTVTYLLEASSSLRVTLSDEHEECRWVDYETASSLPLVWHLPHTLARIRSVTTNAS